MGTTTCEHGLPRGGSAWSPLGLSQGTTPYLSCDYHGGYWWRPKHFLLVWCLAWGRLPGWPLPISVEPLQDNGTDCTGCMWNWAAPAPCSPPEQGSGSGASGGRGDCREHMPQWSTWQKTFTNDHFGWFPTNINSVQAVEIRAGGHRTQLPSSSGLQAHHPGYNSLVGC